MPLVSADTRRARPVNAATPAEEVSVNCRTETWHRLCNLRVAPSSGSPLTRSSARAYRWLTMVAPDSPDGPELVLEPNAHPRRGPTRTRCSATGSR